MRIGFSIFSGKAKYVAMGFLACIALGYQNCSDVRVAKQVEEIIAPSKTSRLAGDFCSGFPGQDVMQVQNFTFLNLTTKAVGKRLLADSDIDGIPDEIENANSSFGYLATDPYSSGILDGICFSQGGVDCVPTPCDQTPLSFGLSQCDATAVSSSTTLTGVDTDLDGIPDLIEILRGLDPLRALLDEDGDLSATGANSNLDEIQKGLDPKSREILSAEFRVSASYRKLVKSSDPRLPEPCGTQDHYSFDVNAFPLLDVAASENILFPELSHARNENVMMAYYVSYPLNSTQRGRIFYQILKVNKDSGPATLRLEASGFRLLGEFDL